MTTARDNALKVQRNRLMVRRDTALTLAATARIEMARREAAVAARKAEGGCYRILAAALPGMLDNIERHNDNALRYQRELELLDAGKVWA
jgi:hypothetical protein